VLHPFTIHVPDTVLVDLQQRLARWAPAPALSGDGWDYGVDPEWLASLVAYWRDQYDWRAVERELNALHHHRVEIAGQTVHFVLERGVGPRPIPIVLTHGWPWTFWDFRKLIGPLTDPAAHGGDPTDAFDVVVASLPGYTFSTPLSRRGLTYVDTADLWVTLMTDVLGFERFAAPRR
jgi:hypothetical protein